MRLPGSRTVFCCHTLCRKCSRNCRKSDESTCPLPS
ncbi:MAG: hypothetical protein K1X57_14750 [Gemmataceae bacterium]|nr:hypothetical protein [Gemmataceae bacterium]